MVRERERATKNRIVQPLKTRTREYSLKKSFDRNLHKMNSDNRKYDFFQSAKLAPFPVLMGVFVPNVPLIFQTKCHSFTSRKCVRDDEKKATRFSFVFVL